MDPLVTYISPELTVGDPWELLFYFMENNIFLLLMACIIKMIPYTCLDLQDLLNVDYDRTIHQAMVLLILTCIDFDPCMDK